MTGSQTERAEKGIFDGEQAQKGYALNKFCYSFNVAENRAAFLADEEAYCARFGLTSEQRAAVAKRDRKALVAQGCNLYYLIKFQRVYTPAREI